MNLLLDTCALLWLASGDERLSEAARIRISAAGVVYVSVVSGFEIALKCQRGKLELPASPAEWFAGIVDHHGLTSVPLDIDDAIRAPQLPDVHRDPCDRFIIACGQRLGVPIVTDDPRFAAYDIVTIA